MRRTATMLTTLALGLLLAGAALAAQPLKVGYSDWPGFTAWEIAKVKGLFKKNGADRAEHRPARLQPADLE